MDKISCAMVSLVVFFLLPLYCDSQSLKEILNYNVMEGMDYSADVFKSETRQYIIGDEEIIKIKPQYQNNQIDEKHNIMKLQQNINTRKQRSVIPEKSSSGNIILLFEQQNPRAQNTKLLKNNIEYHGIKTGFFKDEFENYIPILKSQERAAIKYPKAEERGQDRNVLFKKEASSQEGQSGHNVEEEENKSKTLSKNNDKVEQPENGTISKFVEEDERKENREQKHEKIDIEFDDYDNEEDEEEEDDDEEDEEDEDDDDEEEEEDGDESEEDEEEEDEEEGDEEEEDEEEEGEEEEVEEEEDEEEKDEEEEDEEEDNEKEEDVNEEYDASSETTEEDEEQENSKTLSKNSESNEERENKSILSEDNIKGVDDKDKTRSKTTEEDEEHADQALDNNSKEDNERLSKFTLEYKIEKPGKPTKENEIQGVKTLDKDIKDNVTVSIYAEDSKNKTLRKYIEVNKDKKGKILGNRIQIYMGDKNETLNKIFGKYKDKKGETLGKDIKGFEQQENEIIGKDGERYGQDNILCIYTGGNEIDNNGCFSTLALKSMLSKFKKRRYNLWKSK